MNNILASASVLTDSAVIVLETERSFAAILSAEAVETVAPEIPTRKNGKFRYLYTTRGTSFRGEG